MPSAPNALERLLCQDAFSHWYQRLSLMAVGSRLMEASRLPPPPRYGRKAWRRIYQNPASVMTFRASAIAAPGENLFDESRIHAALDTPDQAIQGGSS